MLDDAVTGLAAYFHTRARVPNAELGPIDPGRPSRRGELGAIAAACGVRISQDMQGVVSSSSEILPLTGAG